MPAFVGSLRAIVCEEAHITAKLAESDGERAGQARRAGWPATVA